MKTVTKMKIFTASILMTIAFQIQAAENYKTKINVKPGQDLQKIINDAKPGTEIILANGDFQTEETITIENKSNLKISGSGKTWIRTKHGWIDVLGISKSSNIDISNVGMIHDVEKGMCESMFFRCPRFSGCLYFLL